jgi:glycosyltransferase involved in cell wall biosynthesis
MRVLIIIPAYNEEANITRVVRTVTDFAAGYTRHQVDYVVINDGSTDATGEICRRNGFETVHLVQNLGIGGAVQTGYLLAQQLGYDAAVQFDGDGQHDIASLDALLRPIEEGRANFVIGSRYLEHTSAFRSTFMRRLGSSFLALTLRIFSGFRPTDPTSGYRAADRAGIGVLARDYPADYPEPESIVILLKHKLRVTEVGVNMFERTGGVSSISPLKSVRYMIKVSLAILCTSFQRREK